MNYDEKIEHLKRSISQMLQERSERFRQADSQLPGVIWTEVLGVFKYLMNLSAEDYLNIRFHTTLITGESVLGFWHPWPPINPEEYATAIGYKFYTENVPEAYWCSEPLTPHIPRPIGINYRGKIINADMLRYQACVTNLYSMGIIKELLGRSRNLILEVGPGYGGCAHNLGNMLPNSTCILMDLPETLLFAGGYLIVNNPNKNIYIYQKSTFTPEFLAGDIYNYDFVLLPNYVLADLYAVPEINLMINMESYQEMSKEQIREYVEFGYAKLSGYMYSHNIDVHPLNNQLPPETVGKILASRFDLFPPYEWYTPHQEATAFPWFYRQYLGIAHGKGLIPEEANIRTLVYVGNTFQGYYITRRRPEQDAGIPEYWKRFATESRM